MRGRQGDPGLAFLAGFAAMVVVALAVTLLLGLEWTCNEEIDHCDGPPEGASLPYLAVYIVVFVGVAALTARWLRRR